MKSIKNTSVIPNILAALALLIYIYLFISDISPNWFYQSSEWITDDAMQQTYQFHEVHHPGILLATLLQNQCPFILPPLHYQLGYFLTWLTGDPVVMSHIMMALQVFLTAIFIFLTIYTCAGFFPACLGALWFLHSGILIQRLTGGLPRGWISPFIAMYLYFVSKKLYKTILLTLLVSCFLNSLAAFLLIASYSTYLFFSYLFKDTREEVKKPIIHFLIACPVYLLVTFYVIKRPEHIGKMVSYEEALKMPSLSSKEGRFKIAPIPPAWFEISTQTFQIFTVDYFKVLRKIKPFAPQIVLSLIGLICFYSFKRKIPPIPRSVYSFLIATLACYFLSRMFAFNLYVPNRYLRFPIGIFYICFFCISLWNIFPKKIYSYAALLWLGAYVYLGTGSGLQKDAGYNYQKGQDGHIFEWIRKYTPESATIAGYPNLVDPLPLFAMRKVYISNETAHPFYDKYFEVVKHRLEVTFRAHYAKTREEFLRAIENENIDYFIFDRKKFSPEALDRADYFPPFGDLIRSLVDNNYTDYFYFSIPKEVETESYPALLFSDSNVALIDVAKLKSLNAPVGASFTR